MHWVTRARLTELAREADATPRRRVNLNLHEMEDAVHRMFQALQPGTYVRPHRHLHPPRSETVVAVGGRVGILVLGASGEILESRILDPQGATIAADIPPETWHTFVALAPESVFFEAKAGPYVRPAGEDLAPWAPEEGTEEAVWLEREWRRRFL